MGRASTLILLVLIAGVVFVFRAPLRVFSYQMVQEVLPCRIAIPYTINSIDAGFDVSRADVERAADDAVAVWELVSGRDLFVELATGTPVITVKFEYDVRQETTETLKDLGSQITNTNAKYESAEAEYDAKRSQFLQQKAAFEATVARFEQDASAYQKEVDSWNARGGATSAVVKRLNAEKEALQKRQQVITAEQQRVNALADEVNALAKKLNIIAGDINATARTYNKVGAQTGEEFEEGVFESRAGSESITVFEFDSQTRLTRLLAHEFGHALGIEHVDGKESIMYRLNQSANIVPTKEDIAALNAVCRL